MNRVQKHSVNLQRHTFAPPLPLNFNTALIGFFILFFFHYTSASGLSFQTQTINASSWWVGNNQGSISPWVYINRTSGDAQIATTPTNDSTIMLRRSGWVQFFLGPARFNVALQRFIGEGTDDLSTFNTSGDTDNSTYWRTSSTGIRPFNSRNWRFTLNHSQQIFDDYITETLQLVPSTTISLPNDLWYVERLGNFTTLDSIMWTKNGSTYGRPLNETNYADNVTFVGIMSANTNQGWHYQLPLDQYANKLAVYNGSAYIAYNLGKTFNAGQAITWNFQKIDADCNISCLPLDAVIINFQEDVAYNCANTTSQVPCNVTPSISLSDTLGSCTWTNTCRLDIQAFTPYNPNAGTFQYQLVNNSPVGNQYAQCLSAYYPASADNCSNANGSASIMNPVKNKVYLFNLIMPGQYNLPFAGLLTSHNLRPFFVSAGIAQTLNGTDRTTPNMTFITKNNTIFPINAGNNITVSWNVTGFLTNVTAIQHNLTGTLTINQTFDLVDLWNNTQSANITNNPINSYGRYCLLANSTSRGSGASGIGKNWTSGKVCQEYRVNQSTTVVTLIQPANNTNTTNTTLLACNATTDNVNFLQNLSIWVNTSGYVVTNVTLASFINESFNYTSNGVATNWTCTACLTDGVCYNASYNIFVVNGTGSSSFVRPPDPRFWVDEDDDEVIPIVKGTVTFNLLQNVIFLGFIIVAGAAGGIMYQKRKKPGEPEGDWSDEHGPEHDGSDEDGNLEEDADWSDEMPASQ